MKLSRLFTIFFVFLVIADLALALTYVHKHWFNSMPVAQYLLATWDWTGRAVTIIGSLIGLAPIVVFVLKREWPKKHPWKQTVASVVGVGSRLSKSMRFLIPANTTLLAIGGLFFCLLLIKQPRFEMPASTVTLSPTASELYEITEASRKFGKILRIDATSAKVLLGTVDVGGNPEKMLIGPRSHCLYILDSENAKVTVLNKDLSLRDVIPSLGKGSSSMVLTPDERKLYIANQQPSPHGTITVVDVASKKSKQIDGFNCPQSLAIVPDGSKIYVATQCGAGHDPVFVISTRTDDKLRTIPDFAIGSEIVVCGKKERAYVSCGGGITVTNGTPVLEPSRISVIDCKRDQQIPEQTIRNGGGTLTTSPDGAYFFFSTEDSITIVNTEKRTIRSLFIGGPSSGVVVGRPAQSSSGLVLYALIRNTGYTFITGLDGLLP